MRNTTARPKPVRRFGPVITGFALVITHSGNLITRLGNARSDHHQPKRVITFVRNQRSPSIGIADHVHRNTQYDGQPNATLRIPRMAIHVGLSHRDESLPLAGSRRGTVQSDADPQAPHMNASKPALGRRVLCKFAGRPGARGCPAGSASWKSPVGRGGRHRAGRAFHLPAHVREPMPEIETALDILAVDNAREITCSSLRSRPQSRRHSQRMKSIGPVSGVHLRKRWIASQYVVFSGGRCAPTIRVRPAGRSASSRASSGELGSSSRCWTSAPPVAGPRFSITKG
jgi:hypothetical protein